MNEKNQLQNTVIVLLQKKKKQKTETTTREILFVHLCLESSGSKAQKLFAVHALDAGEMMDDFFLLY